jgi:tetratricopeptide (TPR) repeat protein
VCALRNQHGQAIEDYITAIRLDPNDADLYVGRGKSWAALGRYASALADFDKAIAVDGECADAYAQRGLLRATCPDQTFRDTRLGVEDAKKACELDAWQDAGSLMVLATASAQGGDLGLAVWARRRVVAVWEAEEWLENVQRLPAGENAGSTNRR